MRVKVLSQILLFCHNLHYAKLPEKNKDGYFSHIYGRVEKN